MSNTDEQYYIRHATREDIPAIVRMLADDTLGEQREADPSSLPPTYYTAFEVIDRDPNHELLVVDDGGTAIGTLHLMFLPALSFQGRMRAQIESVRVDRRFRKRGIGRQLVTHAIERARQAECHLAQLTAHATRQDAHRFYEELGFVPSHVGMKLDLTASHSTAAPSGADS